jgi:hypothetical protein
LHSSASLPSAYSQLFIYVHSTTNLSVLAILRAVTCIAYKENNNQDGS